MKLNLGCGNDKKEGFINADMHSECNPDVVCDLESFPWPWETSSASYVLFNHSLEHMGATPNIFLGIIKELYRVCANECVVEIKVPHPRHNFFWGDPTHVRPITIELLHLFSKKQNQEWQRLKGSNTPFALYLNVDFEVTSVTEIVDEPYLTLFNEKKITREQLDMAIRERNNVVSESHFLLKAIK